MMLVLIVSMKIGTSEFNLRELAGSMGDFGTLFPLAIGYVAVCDLNPSGLLVMMGLANIVTGLIYRLPMPIEPMKLLAVVAIAQRWTPSMVYASGFAMGLIWVLIAGTGIMVWIGRVTPNSVIRGIQASLGILLALQALRMISSWWLVGIASIVLVLILRQNRYAPAAMVLMVLGLAIMFLKGQLYEVGFGSIMLPPITSFRLEQGWQVLLLPGFAQIPLTATNAVMATSSLIKTYWPDRRVTERQLALNMGIMNLILPFFGGMPLCHGAGGLAGQYYFGARTGGTNILEGLIEISIGLFLATSIAELLALFPRAIIGAMMFLVGIELIKFTKDICLNKDLIPMGFTVVFSLATNMACGFLVGTAAHHLIRLIYRRRGYCTCHSKPIENPQG